MRVSGTVQIYDNLRKLMGAGLDFTRQEFFMLLCGRGYIYAGQHADMSDISDEAQGSGYRRERVNFQWQDAGTEMKLTFAPIIFQSRGSPFRVARWIIYRTTGEGALLFSGQVGELGDVTMTEGDDLEIGPDSNGLLRLG